MPFTLFRWSSRVKAKLRKEIYSGQEIYHRKLRLKSPEMIRLAFVKAASPELLFDTFCSNEQVNYEYIFCLFDSREDLGKGETLDRDACFVLSFNVI